jgi:hypothetical protein
MEEGRWRKVDGGRKSFVINTLKRQFGPKIVINTLKR